MSTNQIINQNKNGLIYDIKSKVIMKKIFSHLEENKYLNMIHYNKTLQNILNKDLNDFKNYSRIELEITLVDKNNSPFCSKLFNQEVYGKYINIYNNQSHYHIQTTDDKTIKVILDYEINSFSRMFQRCHYIQKINFIRFKRKNIIDMSYMFNECEYLEEINFTNFITNNVTNMSHMFYGCSSLNELNLNNFNTSNVTNMCDMFNGCSKLNKLNIFNFDTSNVTSMNFMFCGCTRLEEIIIYEFDTSNVKYMNSMFKKCRRLNDKKFLYLDTSNTINKKDMFKYCGIKNN